MQKKVIIFVSLCALGLLGNYFKVSLFFGIDVTFGSIATLFVIALLGIIPGVVAGLIIGSMTLLLWGHPYAMVIFGAEALFVGLVYKNQRNLALVDGFYWLLIGVPLVFVFYGGVLDLPFSVNSVIATKQALNGVLNAVAVGLLLNILSLYRTSALNLGQNKASFRDITFNVISVLVIISATIPSILSSYNFLRELEREAKFELQTVANFVESKLTVAETGTAAAPDNLQARLANQLDELDLGMFAGSVPIALSVKDSNGTKLAILGNMKSSENGTLTRSQSGLVDLWMPSADLPQMKLWKASQYQLSNTIELIDGETINITIEMPTDAVMERHNNNSFQTLLLLTLILGVGLILGHFLSIFLTLPIRRIAKESATISENLNADIAPQISSATLSEFDLLVNSLRTMSEDVVGKFHALNEIRNTLEDKVKERTVELNKLAVVARQVSNAVVITNLDGQIEWVNEGFTRITGFDLAEIVGKKPGSFLQGEESSIEIIAEMSDALKNREPFQVEIINYTRDGTPYWIDISCNPMFNDVGDVVGFIAIETDIDDRKSVELELQDKRNELQEQLQQTIEAQSWVETQAQELVALAESEALARVDAETAGRAKSEFLASMSHEIRTPMTGVLGFADMLLDDNLPDASRDKVLKIIETSKSLLAIINDILDISKINAGMLQIETVDFNPIEVAESVTHLFQQTLSPEKNAALNITVGFTEGFPDFVSGDPTRLRQILLNLMGNAVKFTNKGSVSLRCKSDLENKMLHFEISDTGIGMSPENQKELFKDFAQADASISRKYQGTGLGLSICKRLVELLGGEIEVDSALGQGSTFTFTIPYSMATQETPLWNKDAEPIVKKDIPQLNVLVAEDNDINQTIIGAILEKMGHKFTVVNNGIEAIHAVKVNDFDLILMDVRMPEMSGPEATIEIRKLKSPKANIPIIALTADVMADNRQSYAEAGMNDIVAKPINNNELDAAIRRAVKSDATEPEVIAGQPINNASFDVNELVERLSLPKELSLQLIQMFANNYADVDVRLSNMAEDDQCEDIVKLTHDLRGISGTLGFDEIKQLAAEIETDAKGSDLEAVRKNIERLSTSLKEVMQQVEALL
tara:strand:- start:2832 stop:6137 length:3306 start_codon:yes stop_codon:yes gene_type:complete